MLHINTIIVAYPRKRRRHRFASAKKRRRAKLVERDGPFCICCQIDDKDLEIHHIRKRCNGGTNDLDNLCLLCHVCHLTYHRNEPRFTRGNESKIFKKWCKYMREYLSNFLGENYPWKRIL